NLRISFLFTMYIKIAMRISLEAVVLVLSEALNTFCDLLEIVFLSQELHKCHPYDSSVGIRRRLAECFFIVNTKANNERFIQVHGLNTLEIRLRLIRYLKVFSCSRIGREEVNKIGG